MFCCCLVCICSTYCTVAGRCIPLLPNYTMEEAIFKNEPDLVSMKDVVNGTAVLAQLLSARQVRFCSFHPHTNDLVYFIFNNPIDLFFLFDKQLIYKRLKEAKRI